ncbi:Fumarate hydratase class II [Streptomyces tanashiensis]
MSDDVLANRAQRPSATPRATTRAPPHRPSTSASPRATAIGTGLNAAPGYAETARRRLAELTGLPLVTSANLIEATQDCGAFVQLSGVLKR